MRHMPFGTKLHSNFLYRLAWSEGDIHAHRWNTRVFFKRQAAKDRASPLTRWDKMVRRVLTRPKP